MVVVVVVVVVTIFFKIRVCSEVAVVVALGGYGWVGSVVVIWKLWVCDVVLAGVMGGNGGDFRFFGGGIVILSSEKKRERKER